ncbi:MAG: gamma-glutamylcyclotransferase [Pseudomonadota bacterium]
MALSQCTQPREYWVFAYGSLIWKPGFDYLERRIARLDGFVRRFGLTSKHYRGTPEFPGLVLGLDWSPGDQCTGVALRVCPTKEQSVREYLAERELVSYAYFETLYPVTLLDDGPGQGEARDAICYILDRSHEQYRGDMDPADQAKIIAQAVGPSGPNSEYLLNTLAKLEELGIDDAPLSQMAQQVKGLMS